MKTTDLFLTTLFLTFSLLIPNASAQDYNTWGLPDGATMRLGKGKRTGNIAFSPDGHPACSRQCYRDLDLRCVSGQRKRT